MCSTKESESTYSDEFFDKRVIMEIAGIIESNWLEGPINSFGAMSLKDELLRGIFTEFEKPSAIQQRVIVPIVKGRDVIIHAPSCEKKFILEKIKINLIYLVTGKVTASIIGILQSINVDDFRCQSIILTSDKINAEKIYEIISRVGSIMGTRSYLCIGGTIEQEDMRKLEHGIHVAIGMPNCIKDMIQRKFLLTNHIKILALDNADELLGHGMKEDIMSVFLKLPKSLQVILTTINEAPEIIETSRHLMRNPIYMTVKPADMNELKNVRQFYLIVKHEQLKVAALRELYDSLGFTQAIVFCNFRQKVFQLSTEMTAKGFTVAAIHEKMDHRSIEMALKQFRIGSARLLITTDFLARHKDVQQVSLVINYDLPFKKENYLHR